MAEPSGPRASTGRRGPDDSLDAIGGSWLVGGAQAGPVGHGEAVWPTFPAVSADAELVEFHGDQPSWLLPEFDRSLLLLLLEVLLRFGLRRGSIWVSLGRLGGEVSSLLEFTLLPHPGDALQPPWEFAGNGASTEPGRPNVQRQRLARSASETPSNFSNWSSSAIGRPITLVMLPWIPSTSTAASPWIA